jgi:Na+/H+ antiporter NhaC
VLPVLVVLFATFCGLWATGRASLAADGITTGTLPVTDLVFRDVGTIFGAGNSFHALLWASLAGCLIAAALPLVQRILTMGEALAAWSEGIKSMTLAFVILVLAWSISAVCSDLNTSGFMVDLLSDNLDPRYLSTLVFLIAAVTSFATGTSWGTMGILIPLAVPTAFGLAQSAGFDPEASHRILLGSISAVLAGAIFGDHCSPISDTTVLSSLSTGCDHLDHVNTQIVYALTAMTGAALFGYLASGFGAPPLIFYLGYPTALGLFLWLAGRKPA